MLSSISHAKIIKSYGLNSILEESRNGHLSGEQWLNSFGPLSKYKGVIGPWGPLGSLGPIGKNFWNVTPVFSTIGDWTTLQKYLTKNGGPLSSSGPLFIMSELGQSVFHSMPNAKLLSCGGVLSVLGNSGPLGPLGVLGPLGPNGAHGFSHNRDGDFIDKAKSTVRKIDINGKSYPLYEFYHERVLTRSMVFDTSFSIEGEMGRGEKIELEINSSEGQWISILIQNQFELDTFYLNIYDDQGQKVISSENDSLVNFVHLKVDKNTTFKIEIVHQDSLHFLIEKPYRLFVTGSGEGVEEELNPNAIYFR